MRFPVRHLSPSLVISCIALFLALGGVSYGFATGDIDSREIKNNTIRGKDIRDSTLTTKDIRNNEVRGADIRNSTIGGRDVAFNTLGGNDIKESTLGAVPSALNSTSLGGVAASGYVRREAPAFTDLTLNPGWTQATDSAVAGFDIDGSGYVHLRGRVAGGTGSPFTLPAGTRPASVARFPVVTGTASGTVGVLSIDADGVATAAGLSGGLLSLDGVTFPAGG